MTRTLQFPKSIENHIIGQLTDEDDPAFWKYAIAFLSVELVGRVSTSKYTDPIFLQLGACSHWLRPHQARMRGGFAWPVGYKGAVDSRTGLPEFDWFIILKWDHIENQFVLKRRIEGKRKLVCRVALPTRTLRHEQAAVHTIWMPGDPTNPKKKLTRFYGFRFENDRWRCKVAQSFPAPT
jgi:hypothetical protein